MASSPWASSRVKLSLHDSLGGFIVVSLGLFPPIHGLVDSENGVLRSLSLLFGLFVLLSNQGLGLIMLLEYFTNHSVFEVLLHLPLHVHFLDSISLMGTRAFSV